MQVYAAYHSGLANGTSVKLNVTHATTAREVVDLVVKQLNMAVIIKVTFTESRLRFVSTALKQESFFRVAMAQCMRKRI